MDQVSLIANGGCNKGYIMVQIPVCNLRLDQVRPIYGWWRFGLLYGRWAIGREKQEGGNSYMGKRYRLYGNSVRLSGSEIGQAVL